MQLLGSVIGLIGTLTLILPFAEDLLSGPQDRSYRSAKAIAKRATPPHQQVTSFCR
jgi:hypothetical protein